MTMEMVLFNPITVILAGYLVVAVTLTIATQPLRLRMVELANEMLAGNCSDEFRAHISWLVNNSMSMKIAAILPVAVLATMFEHLLGGETESDETELRHRDDPRYRDFVWRYLLSTLACAPVFAVVSLFLMAISVIVQSVMKPGSLRGLRMVTDSVEEPVLRAASAGRYKAKAA